MTVASAASGVDSRTPSRVRGMTGSGDMTPLEQDLHLAWDRLADAEAEHDEEAARQAWEIIKKLQQRS